MEIVLKAKGQTFYKIIFLLWSRVMLRIQSKHFWFSLKISLLHVWYVKNKVPKFMIWTFFQSPKVGKTWLLEKKMLPISLLGGLKINFKLVKIFIYFWLWVNSILTQCSGRTKVRKKCEFPSILSGNIS